MELCKKSSISQKMGFYIETDVKWDQLKKFQDFFSLLINMKQPIPHRNNFFAIFI
jgi:hypothetical protein